MQRRTLCIVGLVIGAALLVSGCSQVAPSAPTATLAPATPAATPGAAAATGAPSAAEVNQLLANLSTTDLDKELQVPDLTLEKL